MPEASSFKGSTASRLRVWLDLVSTVLVIVVSVALLYRILRPVSRTQGAAVRGQGVAQRAEAPLPSQPLLLDRAAIKGDPKAPVAIIAFSDFQCPYCRVFAHDTWPALQEQFVDTGKVQFVFRHLPLDNLHPQARRIGAGAECARKQGRFWEFHDALFAKQKELPTADLIEVANGVGVAKVAFGECIESKDAEAVVQADSISASALGVSGTPTFFVGRVNAASQVVVSQRLVGAQSVTAFGSAIASALADVR